MKEISRRVKGLRPEPERPSAPPEEIPAHVFEAVRAALDAGETHYVARPGLFELRQEIARAIEKRGGPRYDPKTSIVVTAGEEEALYVTVLARSKETEPANVVTLGDILARPRVALPKIAPDAIVVGSLDALPGVGSFRVGFVAGPEAVMKRVQTWKQALSICTAGPSQRAALAALRRIDE